MPTGKYKRKWRSDEHRKNLSLSLMGNKPSKETIEKLRKSHLGHKQSEETKIKRSETLKKIGHKPPIFKGEKSSHWKGGLTESSKRIRNSAEYRLWRTAVFQRDKYTCVWCGQIGGTLNADHIKPFAWYPELRFAIDNGRTLCIDCHKKTDTYARKGIKRNNKKEL